MFSHSRGQHQHQPNSRLLGNVQATLWHEMFAMRWGDCFSPASAHGKWFTRQQDNLFMTHIVDKLKSRVAATV